MTTYTLRNVNSNSADPASVALNVNSGSLLVVSAMERSGQTDLDNYTISDTASNTWTARAGRVVDDATFRRSFRIWTAVANATGSTTVTVDDGTANTKGMIFAEYENGVVTWHFHAAVDNDNGLLSHSASVETGTTGSIDAGGDKLMLGFLFVKRSANGDSLTGTFTTENLTHDHTLDGGANSRCLSIGSATFTAGGTKTSTAGFTSTDITNVGLGAALLVFSDTAATAGSSNAPRAMHQRQIY